VAGSIQTRKRYEAPHIDGEITKNTKPWYFSILGYQFNKKLESFAPYYSQSLLLADLKENQTLPWF
jgi:hypothetical protein